MPELHNYYKGRLGKVGARPPKLSKDRKHIKVVDEIGLSPAQLTLRRGRSHRRFYLLGRSFARKYEKTVLDSLTKLLDQERERSPNGGFIIKED